MKLEFELGVLIPFVTRITIMAPELEKLNAILEDRNYIVVQPFSIFF